MAVVFAKFLPFTASVINLVINLVLLVVGFAFLGRNFGLKTAYVTVLSSVLLNVFEHLFPMSGPLTDQISLELCFAILLPAIAAALLFFENASGGGTEGYSPDFLREVLAQAEAGPRKLMRRILKLAPERVHTLVPGMVVISAAAELCGAGTIVTSGYGVREGYLEHMLERDGVISA